MRDIHTEKADILFIENFWQIKFKKNVVVTLLDILKIYRLISTFDLNNPLLLDIQNIDGIEFEALEFTASKDELTERVQIIVYANNSISEKYVHLIENLDLGSHDYQIFDNLSEAREWISKNIVS